jgi:hypothetical protein
VKIKLEKEKLNDIINRLKKKSFVFFGTKREHLDYARLILTPVYFCTVRRKKRTLLKERIEEFNICFDAVTGDILVIDDARFRRLKGFDKLTNLKDIEIAVIRELFAKRRMLNLAELYSSLEISGSLVKSALNRLMKENIIMSKEDRFGINFDIDFSSDISKYSSDIKEKSNEYVEGEFLKEKIDFSIIKKAFEEFFSAEIIGNSLIYYPIYEIKLSTKRRSRICLIDGISGKFIP